MFVDNGNREHDSGYNDADLDDKDDDDADDAANRKNEIVSVMSYKPVFCRNHANTPVSRTF